MIDHIDPAIDAKYIVALTDSATVETPMPDIAQTYQRGIYCFSNKKVAKRFTNLCNDAIKELGETIAHMYENKVGD